MSATNLLWCYVCGAKGFLSLGDLAVNRVRNDSEQEKGSLASKKARFPIRESHGRIRSRRYENYIQAIRNRGTVFDARIAKRVMNEYRVRPLRGSGRRRVSGPQVRLPHWCSRQRGLPGSGQGREAAIAGTFARLQIL